MDIVDAYMVLTVFSQACIVVAAGICPVGMCLRLAGKMEHSCKTTNVAFVLTAVGIVSLLAAEAIVYLSRLTEN